MFGGLDQIVSTAIAFAAFGGLIALSVVLARPADRIGMPVVLVLLGLGMLAGSEGLGIPFDDYELASQLGTLALVFILLDGGLNTRRSMLKAGAAPASVLATFGVVGTAAMTALAARLFGLSWPEAIMIGAVVSSTDAAAVFAVLRGSGVHLKQRVKATLELESCVNDPMAVILTTAAIAWFTNQSASVPVLLAIVPMQLAIGAAVGALIGYLTSRGLRRVRLTVTGLYPALTIAAGLVAYGVATLVHGSGFLAVFVAGFVLGNSQIPYRGVFLRVHDALAWLSQISMFLMLGLLVFPSQLLPVALQGMALGLFLAFVGRPLVVAACLAPFGFPKREIAYVGWAGLRGAVPIVLATYPLIAGVGDAGRVFNVVFFIVVVSTIVPGMGIRPLGRRLGVTVAPPSVPSAALEMHTTRLLDADLMVFHISESLVVSGAKLSELHLPSDAAVTLIVRGEHLIAPRGNARLQPGDHAYVFCQSKDRPLIELLFGRPQVES
ncbi:MAG: potassium/proton antiporter [Phycisphaerales bacterium]|nr:potassium/proton antiporter [Phycisphaerales bacterium]